MLEVGVIEMPGQCHDADAPHPLAAGCKAAPAKQLLDQYPRPAKTNSAHPRQLRHLRLQAAGNLLALLRFERLDLRLDQHQPRHLAFDSRTQGRRQLRSVARTPLGPVAPANVLDAPVVPYQKRTDPIGVRFALLPELLKLPMRAPRVFLLRRGQCVTDQTRRSPPR